MNSDKERHNALSYKSATVVHTDLQSKHQRKLENMTCFQSGNREKLEVLGQLCVQLSVESLRNQNQLGMKKIAWGGDLVPT